MKGVKFSIVYMRDIHIFMQGFIMPDDLSYSTVFKQLFEEIPMSEDVYVEIHHLVLMDNRTPLRDALEHELKKIRSNFQNILDDGRIYLEEIVEVDIPAEEDVYIVEG